MTTDEIRALLAAATPGPWTVGHVNENGVSWFDVRSKPDANGWRKIFCEVDDCDDARLIAAAPDIAAIAITQAEEIKLLRRALTAISCAIVAEWDDDLETFVEVAMCPETMAELARAALKEPKP